MTRGSRKDGSGSGKSRDVRGRFVASVSPRVPRGLPPEALEALEAERLARSYRPSRGLLPEALEALEAERLARSYRPSRVRPAARPARPAAPPAPPAPSRPPRRPQAAAPPPPRRRPRPSTPTSASTAAAARPRPVARDARGRFVKTAGWPGATRTPRGLPRGLPPEALEALEAERLARPRKPGRWDAGRAVKRSLGKKTRSTWTAKVGREGEGVAGARDVVVETRARRRGALTVEAAAEMLGRFAKNKTIRQTVARARRLQLVAKIFNPRTGLYEYRSMSHAAPGAVAFAQAQARILDFLANYGKTVRVVGFDFRVLRNRPRGR